MALKKICCYGFLSKDAGSLASAYYLIFDMLLKRGHRVDLYGIENVSYPEDYFNYPNFHYISLPKDELAIQLVSTGWQFLLNLPRNGWFLHPLWGLIHHAVCNATFTKLAQKRHQQQPYDVVMFLGLPGFFRVSNTPTVSWLQGTFLSEGRAIVRLKSQIIQLCGTGDYLKFRGYYLYRALTSTRNYLKHSDWFICGSKWAKSTLIAEGVKPDIIQALPYPIDVQTFTVDVEARSSRQNQITFLWLGRIVPRKRLDLLLAAFELLLQEDREVYLKIIGKFSYAQGYKTLIDQFGHSEHFSYQPQIPRAEVPALLKTVDIIIQPSEDENFGSAIAEALCCGLPVILGPTNGTKDYTGPAGFVFDDYSPNAVKIAMKQAIAAVRNDRLQLTQQARQTAEQMFDIATVTDELEKTLDQVIAKYRI